MARETYQTVKNRARDAAFFDLRRRGVSTVEAGRRLGLSKTITSKLGSYYSADNRPEATPDSSCPKFARHDPHVSDVISAGGFVRWSERLSAPGRPIVCFPIIPFSGAEGARI